MYGRDKCKCISGFNKPWRQNIVFMSTIKANPVGFAQWLYTQRFCLLNNQPVYRDVDIFKDCLFLKNE